MFKNTGCGILLTIQLSSYNIDVLVFDFSKFTNLLLCAITLLVLDIFLFLDIGYNNFTAVLDILVFSLSILIDFLILLFSYPLKILNKYL